jgi:hypothetical protein
VPQSPRGGCSLIRSFITKAATVATVATLVATPVVAQAQQVLNFSGTALINDPTRRSTRPPAFSRSTS